jgi:hypothetical protein
MPVFPHDSMFLAWLNVFPAMKECMVKGGFKRTPYPPVISNPNYFDVIKNFNRADIGLFLIFNLV